MSAVVTLPQGAGLCHLPSPFRLERGGELRGAALAWRRTGAVGVSEAAPVVVVLGGISAHRDVEAWWPEQVGEGLAIDTRRVQVLSFDWLGGAGASTSPASGERFPFVAAADQARALWALCDALRIDRLHAIVGSSYGGMVALHAAAQAPERVDRLAVVAAAHESAPQASAWRHVQRRIVEDGLAAGRPLAALALARQLAMTTYRSPAELDQRFAGGVDDADLHGWLDARGADFAGRWNAEQFLCLNRSIDGHAITPGAVRVPTSLLAFDSDQLVPTRQVRELALRLPDLRLWREQRSCYGHDAFLKETAAVAAFLKEVLR
ncbi:MAG: alpha/beta fold hydrolase [Planctomycetes bacterium]|nr:alpha/beta fold hydrolase [Planctomycetota bacterium]